MGYRVRCRTVYHSIMKSKTIGWMVVMAAVLAGCASQRPVLYPNAKLKQVGDAAARQDVDDCIRLADQAGATHGGGERAVRRGAEGAAVGGVTGAVAGAVGRRNVLDSAAAGAAVGGAAAGTYGAIRSDEPGEIHRNFVQRCLSERGYDVIGWQ
jgi:outer membrane lipoprotein SlyB